MRKLLTVVTMLTVAPVTAVTALVLYAPERWGGSLNPLNILAMSVLGLCTVPLWPTYIPAVILMPRLMSGVSSHRWFAVSPLWLLLLLSCVVGAALGTGVLAPVLLMSVGDKTTVRNWAIAGAVSGAVTLAAVTCIYRFTPPEAKSPGSPHKSPAVPPPFPGTLGVQPR